VFRITVPAPPNNGGTVISHLEVTLRVANVPSGGNSVAFNVTDPRPAAPVAQRIPGSGFNPPTSMGGTVDFLPVPPGSAGLPAPDTADSANMTAPVATGPAGLDPNAARYKLILDLASDRVFGAGGSIDTTMSGNENWTVDLLSQVAGSNSIGSACVQSFKYGTSIGSEERILLPATGAFVENVEVPTQVACQESRPGLDVILVLDRSGSMASSTLGGAPRPKIDALHDAVLDFVQTWAEVRATESSPPSDNLGVVIFNHAAEWWAPVSTVATPLQPFAAAKAAIEGSVASITAAGATSIGAGLLLADGALATASSTRRRVVLVMSNGMQNVSPLVGVTATTPKRVFTHSSGSTSGPQLPNQDNYQIYAVTVGTGLAVSAQINEDIASATQGFYVNSETTAEALRTYFIELLQNFVRFNTWETARLANGSVTVGTSFDMTFRVATTSTHAAIVVTWPRQFGQLRAQITPPGEATETEIGSGSIRRTFEIAKLAAYEHLGEWKVTVDVPGTIDAMAGTHVAALPTVPIDVAVLVDDRAVNADLDIADAEVTVGSPVRLRAGITELGRPVLGLGTRPGETVVAQVVKPGQSIGDLLAASEAPSTPAPTGDQQSPAEAKLFNELQQNPDALKQQQDLISLTDPDGDGVYTGQFATREPGHYTFLFGVQGRTKEAGFVSRQQVKSVWVRPVPDPAASAISIDTTSTRTGKRLIINVKPKTKFGNLLGPGYANYLWFTTPNAPAVKPIDDLRGGYTAMIDFSGDVPPVSLHFIGASILITDEVTQDQLSIPLDDRTMVVPQIPGTGSQGTGCLFVLVTLIQRIIRIFRP
jgi:hypothetical protein